MYSDDPASVVDNNVPVAYSAVDRENLQNVMSGISRLSESVENLQRQLSPPNEAVVAVDGASEAVYREEQLRRFLGPPLLQIGNALEGVKDALVDLQMGIDSAHHSIAAMQSRVDTVWEASVALLPPRPHS